MFSAEDAVTPPQLTSSSLRWSEWWMPRSRPPSRAWSGNLISSCRLALSARKDWNLTLFWSPGLQRQTREQTTENGEERITTRFTLRSPVVQTPQRFDPDGNRPSEQDKQCESTFPSTTPPARIEIDIRCHPRTKTTPYIVGHFPSPAFLPSSPRLGNSPSSRRFWGSSGRNPWHGCQASRLLPSTVPPRRRRGGFPLPPPPSLSMFQKRELSSSPDLSRSGCTVYF